MATRDVLFVVKTPLGITVHTTKDYWKIITTIKHPSMVKYELLRSKLRSIPSGKFFCEPFIPAASCEVFWFKNKAEVKKALKDPDQIRNSKQDPRVHLYYKNIGRVFVCVVADHASNTEGYIITTYLTDKVKEGEQIYVKD